MRARECAATVGLTGMGENGPMTSDRRRSLPRVDALLEHPQLVRCALEWGHDQVVREVRRVLDAARDMTGTAGTAPASHDLAERAARELDARAARRIRAVINATGVILHTNLGRAPLSAAACDAVLAAAGYSTVEYDLVRGGRAGAAPRWNRCCVR